MLGGGTFTTQSKILPGTYINVVSTGNNNSTLGERGVVALPIALSWGNPGEIITVTAGEFMEDAISIFGYAYDAPEMKSLREVFKHAQKVHVYNLADGTDAKEAACTNATAKKAGSRGNALKLVVQKNIEDESLFDVTLYLDTTAVFSQTVASAAELSENKFVTWKDAQLAVTAGLAFSGGADGSVSANSHLSAREAYESKHFNILVCPSVDEVSNYVDYTKRMRDELGLKFQTVIQKNISADYEGVVQLLEEQAEAIYWTAGALAGCAENQSCTNMTYDGEATITTKYTRVELEGFIKKGVFAFHDVEDEVRVLLDINSLTSFTVEKNDVFSTNQVIRVADGCAMDAARIFNNKYLGKIQNDESGRTSFWNDVLTNRRERETIRAISLYDSGLLKVVQGEKRNSVVVSEVIVPISTMEKLYMTTVIN